MAEAREELKSMLGDDRLRDCCLLVLANKQDMPRAASVAQVADKLQLQMESQRQWHVQGTCASSGEGFVEGFTWLEGAIKEERKKRRVSPF